MVSSTNIELPGLDCGICGYRTCDEMRRHLPTKPDLLRRCIHLSKDRVDAESTQTASAAAPAVTVVDPPSCPPTCGRGCNTRPSVDRQGQLAWHDNLGREFDFYLEHFPEEPGPREIILPHNPLITREMEIQVGDILIGRPLGMSCGCPITHCGVAMEVDRRTGVIVWCVTGPLTPREKGYKDLGYYIAEGYEGLIHECRADLKVGMRYFFQPRMCMLQWRHSGLVNYLSRNGASYQVRLEGLWIG
jgi:uncharacterized Fe-S cluster-containing protein